MAGDERFVVPKSPAKRIRRPPNREAPLPAETVGTDARHARTRQRLVHDGLQVKPPTCSAEDCTEPGCKRRGSSKKMKVANLVRNGVMNASRSYWVI